VNGPDLHVLVQRVHGAFEHVAATILPILAQFQARRERRRRRSLSKTPGESPRGPSTLPMRAKSDLVAAHSDHSADCRTPAGGNEGKGMWKASVVLKYGLAVVTVAIALGLSLLGQSQTVEKVEFPLLLMAIAVTVWYAGTMAGVVAVALSSVGFNYFFTQPLYTLYIESADRPVFVVFLLFAFVIASFSSRRRRIEHDLRQARDELESEVAARSQQASLLDLTHDTIFVRDMSDVITYWNRGAEELYGWRAEHAVGKRAHELLQTVFPMPIEEIHGELLRAGRWEGELDKRKADGTPVAVASRWSLRRDGDERPVAILETNNDISERKRQEQEVRKLNDDLAKRTTELQASNKELEAFAYSISHDLRAPLRHTVGYTELLQKNAFSALDEKNRRYMTMILEAGKRMGNLIDDLLAFSRIGRAETRKATVSLDALVKEALDELRPEIEGRHIAWTIAALPDVYGDRSMLRLALVNLISNAVKFTRTRPQARIEIGRADGRDGETVVFVRDNGVGFDMKYADKLFGVFQRLHHTDAFEGTGIGLATVQRIIHRHEGRVWSEGLVDGGATFYVLVPRSLGESKR
jgi:PAS domain S-box-containing protein